MEAKAHKVVHPYRKLSKELIDIIVKDIEEGSPNKHACESNGITESIFYIWLDQGFIDICEDKPSLCSYLVESLRKVEKKEIKECRKLIRKSKSGHKGAEWTLEHAFWRYFSSRIADIEFNERLSKLEHQQNGASQNGQEMDSSNAHEEGRAS